MLRYFPGLDLGDVNDYTAFCIVERVLHVHGETIVPHFNVRHLERFNLGTGYPEIAESVKKRLEFLEPEDYLMFADATGVGRPVVQGLRRDGLQLMAILITGGTTITKDAGGFNVPKRDLVGALQLLMQQRRLKFSRHLPEIKALVKEFENFRIKINKKTGNDQYEAWRENDKDDMVLSVACACWGGLHTRIEMPGKKKPAPKQPASYSAGRTYV